MWGTYDACWPDPDLSMTGSILRAAPGPPAERKSVWVGQHRPGLVPGGGSARQDQSLRQPGGVNVKHRIPVLAAAVVGLLALPAGGALATVPPGTLDASQTELTSTYPPSSGHPLAQTFTATLTGKLDTVQIHTTVLVTFGLSV